MDSFFDAVCFCFLVPSSVYKKGILMNNFLLFISTFLICLTILFGWKAVIDNDIFNKKMLSTLNNKNKRQKYLNKGAKLEGGNVSPKKKK